MKKMLFVWMIAILYFSCKTEENKRTENNKQLTLAFKPSKNIQFDFEGYRWQEDKKTVYIKASLQNNGTDTAFLLTYTCEGEVYQIETDTAAVQINPFVMCNASYPTIVQIAPKQKHYFEALATLKKDVADLKLGFNFYDAGKYYSAKLLRENFESINQETGKHHDILWASNHAIKVITDTTGLKLRFHKS